jgi:hypothetical protein
VEGFVAGLVYDLPDEVAQKFIADDIAIRIQDDNSTLSDRVEKAEREKRRRTHDDRTE